MPNAPPVYRPRGDKRRQERAYDAQRQHAPARRIRNSARWQEFRDWFKRRHPLCADPFGTHRKDGRVVPGVHVHHIAPLSRRPELAFVESNCAALCAACHNKVEGMIRAGESVGAMFERRSG